jgi:hypothetical protein
MLLLADGGKLKVLEAMRLLAGLSHKDLMTRAAQMQVPCMAEKLKNERKKPPLYPPPPGSSKHHASKSLTAYFYTVIVRHKEECDEKDNKNETQ